MPMYHNLVKAHIRVKSKSTKQVGVYLWLTGLLKWVIGATSCNRRKVAILVGDSGVVLNLLQRNRPIGRWWPSFSEQNDYRAEKQPH